MSGYATGTTVSVDKSRAEIERTLRRFGASAFLYGQDQDKAIIGFVMRERRIQMSIAVPTNRDVNTTPQGRTRTGASILTALAQEERRRWRALLLIIKAKLTAIEDGVTTFEQEWAMHMVLPDGRVAGEVVNAAIEQAYEQGEMPPLLGITAGPAR